MFFFFSFFPIQWKSSGSKTPLDHNEFYSMGMLTPTNNHMTRCLWTVTNSPQLSCTLFMLCGGKQRPCQSLFGRQRQIFSVCGGRRVSDTCSDPRGEKNRLETEPHWWAEHVNYTSIWFHGCLMPVDAQLNLMPISHSKGAMPDQSV